MNVLSLFDGISCGRVALERAGIDVKNYFASEVEQSAINISKKNFPDIKHIGDVCKINISDLPKIDIIIGGSPCQGFSTAGKEHAFTDPRSKLFFEFVRLKKEAEQENPELKFLLENVGMKPEYRQIISDNLGIGEVPINSSRLSAQNRPRFYWSNIKYDMPHDAGYTLEEVLGIPGVKVGQMQPFPRDYKKKGLKRFERLECRTDKKSNAVITNPRKNILLFPDGYTRIATPTECEILQTLPKGYTEGVPDSHRYKAIGNGWTVDVIAHILCGVYK